MKGRFYITLFFLLLGMLVRSQSFTPGNIVVVRIGDGAAPLNNITAPVFLEEYTPGGSFVQTIPMPTVAIGSNKMLTFQGNNSLLGALTLSADHRYLSLVGYNVPPMTAGSDAINVATQRVIGVIDYNGVINTSTGLINVGTNQAYSAVTSNGTDIWASFTSGGLRYTTLGGTSSTPIVTATNTRTVSIFSGNLYYGASNGSILRINNILPTTGPQTTTTLISSTLGGFSQNGYFLADLNPAISGYDVIYFSGDANAIKKFSFNGTSWVANGTVGVSTDVYSNMAGVVNGTTVTLYVTRKVVDGATTGQPSEIVSFVDNTGHTLAANSFTGTPTLLVTSAVNTGFRGIAMAPVKCKTPELRIVNSTPISVDIAISDSIIAGSYEYEVSTNPIATAPGLSAPGGIIRATGLTPGTVYYVHVRRSCGGGNFSAWTTTTFTTTWPPCVSPNNLMATVSGNNQLTLRWQPVFTALHYEYAVTVSATPPVSGLSTTNISVSPTGLSSVSSYYLHARAHCGSGDTSLWASKAFLTPCFGVSPYLIKNNPQTGTAVLGWNGETGSNIYEYAILTTPSPPSGVMTSTSDTVLHVSNLSSGNTYYLYVRKKCKDKSVSNWSMVEFNTSGLGVYPNPFADQLTIRVVGQGVASAPVKIYDSYGRLIKQLVLSSNTATVDTRGWAAGVYYVRYGNEKGYVTKIIKP